MTALTAKCILDALRADGYNVSIGSMTERDDRSITYHAMATRAGETWRASADSEYQAAFELAVQLGWELDE